MLRLFFELAVLTCSKCSHMNNLFLCTHHHKHILCNMHLCSMNLLSRSKILIVDCKRKQSLKRLLLLKQRLK